MERARIEYDYAKGAALLAAGDVAGARDNIPLCVALPEAREADEAAIELATALDTPGDPRAVTEWVTGERGATARELWERAVAVRRYWRERAVAEMRRG